MIGIDSADSMLKEQVDCLHKWYNRRGRMDSIDLSHREFFLIDPKREHIDEGIRLGFSEELLRALLRSRINSDDVVFMWMKNRLSKKLEENSSPIELETTQWLYVLAHKERGIGDGGDYTVTSTPECFTCPNEALEALYDKEYGEEDSIIMMKIPCLQS